MSHLNRVPKNDSYINQNMQSNTIVQTQESKPQGTAQLPTQKEEDKMPLFLIKLWNIVEDPSYQQIIRWDPSGYSFHIVDPYSFCRNVLPHYFKHNNLNSLIRQLNMYGFRKMSPLDRGGLTRSESDQDHLEFSHACFIRDRPDLLVNIKRKQSSRPADTVAQSAQNNIQLVMDELRQLRDKQKKMDMKMHELTKENESLWEQMVNIRAQHNRQQQVVQKLVQFLVAMVQPSLSKRVQKRGVLAIDENPAKRPRTTPLSTGNSNNNLSEILDRLQKELVDNGGLQTGGISNNSRGPIIADVTEELGQYVQSPETRNNGDSIIYNPDTTGCSPMQYQTPPQGVRMNPYDKPYAQVRRRSQPTPKQPSPMMQPQQRQPPAQQAAYPTISQNYQAPTTSAVSIPSNPIVPPSSSHQYGNNAPGTISMSPALERQISTELQVGLGFVFLCVVQGALVSHFFLFVQSGVSGLQEYLNGVDMNIDNCRDLLSGHWDFDFLEHLSNDDPDQPRSSHQLALEHASPKDELFASNDLEIQEPFVDNSLNHDLIYPATPELLTPSTSPRS